MHTQTQSLNIALSAIGRQVFVKQKCFQYATTMYGVVFWQSEIKTL